MQVQRWRSYNGPPYRYLVPAGSAALMAGYGMGRNRGYNLIRGAVNMARRYYGSRGAKPAAVVGKQLANATYGNKRVYRAYKKQMRKKKPFNKVKSQLRELKRVVEGDMGTHIHRIRRTGRVVVAAVNQSVTLAQQMSDLTYVEAVLAQLRYYNPSSPATLVTADGTTGSYQKEFYFKRVYGRFTVRNNYQVPCKCSLYLVSPKMDTSIPPHAAFTNGLADVGNPSSTSTLVHPTDSLQFNDLWKIVKSKTYIIKPGAQRSITHSVGSFQYDPATSDSHILDYQTIFKAFSVLIRLEGILGHDTTVTTEQTSLLAGVDWEAVSVFEVRYAAGADIKFITLDDTGDTAFTNSGVASSMPVSDNIGYSIS